MLKSGNDSKNGIFKRFAGDSLLSIVGLVILNAITQFIVYPSWNRLYGFEEYGNIIFYISVMWLFSVTIGTAGSYSRISSVSDNGSDERIYARLMLISGVLVVAIAAVVYRILGHSSFREISFYMILAVVTMWRYYCDVGFKIRTDYKGMCIYNIIIGVGYIFGMALMKITDIWMLALIPGEILGVIYSILCEKPAGEKKNIQPALFRKHTGIYVTLVISYFISNLIFFSDRILLKLISGGSAVSRFYIASLLGKTMSFVTIPLNGVISGYLAKKKTPLSIRLMNIISACAVLSALVFALLCTLGSYILLPLLYGDDFDMVKGYVFVCNLSSTLYFVSNTLSVVLLMYSESKYQLIINILYAIMFCAICIPLTIINGFQGYCTGIIIVSSMLLMYCLLMGYYIVIKAKKQKRS